MTQEEPKGTVARACAGGRVCVWRAGRSRAVGSGLDLFLSVMGAVAHGRYRKGCRDNRVRWK